MTGNISHASSFTLDVGGGITLDADGGQVDFKDNGTLKALIDFTGNNVEIQSRVTDADLLFRGQDGSSFITALTLDMSNSGAAIFNSAVTTGSTITVNSGHLNLASDGAHIYIGADIDMRLTHDGSNGTLRNDTGDLTLDIAGELIIDTDLQGSGNGILLKDAGTLYGSIFRSSSHLHIKAEDQDKDLLFMGNDGGTEITALTLDMSAAGLAVFNAGATFAGIGGVANIANDLTIFSSTSGHNGLRFHLNGILPTDNAGAIVDNDADLGEASYRFKDLYLSSSAFTPVVQGLGDEAGLTFGGALVAPRKNNAAADGTVDLGASSARFNEIFISNGINNGTNAIAFSSGAFAGNGSGNDANIDLGRNNRRFRNLYLSGGAFIGGTGSANKLDDYEEGTWTPAFANGFDGNYTVQQGQYTKIGRQVIAALHLDINSASTGSTGNQIQVSGLPFLPDVGTTYGGSTSIHGSSWATGRTSLNMLVGDNSTTAALYINMCGGIGATIAPTYADIGTGNLLAVLIYNADT